ncbi:hypothetical protein ACHAW6_005121 [Cyclotella cf. meneghiniana]
MTMGIANFYLNTPLKCPEFSRMGLINIPKDIIQEFKLFDLLNHDNYMYIRIVLGMYGRLHTNLIANKLLGKCLNAHGYHQNKQVPRLWKHYWHSIWFTLVVDHFGATFVGKEHALHLKSALES